jgi:hypothetical protein
MNSFIFGMKKFFQDLSFVISFFLLIITYFFGVFVTFLFAKILRKKFLDNKPRESYWKDLNLKEKPLREYYKQF